MGQEPQLRSPLFIRLTPYDRYIVVIYEEIDDETMIPVTAYEIREP